METRRMPSLRLVAIHKHGNRLSGHVIHSKAYMARLRKRVVDHRFRIERIGVVLSECYLCRQFAIFGKNENRQWRDHRQVDPSGTRSSVTIH